MERHHAYESGEHGGLSNGIQTFDADLHCTDAATLPKPPWQACKEAYIAHLEHAAPDVRFVSCADKLHNARAIGTDLRTHGLAVYDRFKGGCDGTLWYYRTLSKVFTRLLPGPLAAELAEAVQEMERLSRS